jgi:hypothetical protein
VSDKNFNSTRPVSVINFMSSITVSEKDFYCTRPVSVITFISSIPVSEKDRVEWKFLSDTVIEEMKVITEQGRVE